MKWPVALIGGVLVIAVIVFALSYGNPKTSVSTLPLPITSTTSGGLFGTSTVGTIGSGGVAGIVRVRCLGDDGDPSCEPQVRIIEAYQGISSVGLFKTTPEGVFRAELPPGHYELRVAVASSTRCVSIGIVVPENAFISANLSCEAGQ